MSTTKATYEVKRGFYLSQQFIAAAPEGTPAVTVSLTEREARYHLLAGDVVLEARLRHDAPLAINAPSNGS